MADEDKWPTPTEQELEAERELLREHEALRVSLLTAFLGDED